MVTQRGKQPFVQNFCIIQVFTTTYLDFRHSKKQKFFASNVLVYFLRCDDQRWRQPVTVTTTCDGDDNLWRKRSMRPYFNPGAKKLQKITSERNFQLMQGCIYCWGPILQSSHSLVGWSSLTFYTRKNIFAEKIVDLNSNYSHRYLGRKMIICNIGFC
jgi:hypothetical protein